MRQVTALSHQAAGRLLRGYLPVLVFLAYLAFLLTGFGDRLGDLQPVPVYLFLALVLLTLQDLIAENRAWLHIIYTFLASTFAVLYAGEVVYNVRPFNFTRNPLTYVLLNAVLLLVFLADTWQRRRWARLRPATRSARYGAWAIDVAAVALFFYVSAFLLDLLAGQVALRRMGLHIGQPYVQVDLNRLFGLHLGSPVNTLEGLNLLLAVGATALALALLVVAGVLLPTVNDGTEELETARSVWVIVRQGATQVAYALRLVAGPLIWLIPAFSLAVFADYVARYFNASARTPSTVVDLFNPFSPVSRANYMLGVSTLLLGLLAVVATVASVALMEKNYHMIERGLRTIAAAGRSVALTWALFMYSLAAINATAILVGVTRATPLQVGAPGLFALIVGASMLLYELRRAPHTGQPGEVSRAEDNRAAVPSRPPFPLHGGV